MPETRQEETRRKRASRKVPAARDAAVRPSRRLTTRPGEQAVSQLGEEVLGDDLDQELEIVSEIGENSSEVGELEDATEMAGEESDLRAILRMMCERDEQYRRDMAETAEVRRKEEEKLRKASEEARRVELCDMFKQMKELEEARAEQQREAEADRIREEEEFKRVRREEEDKKKEKRERYKEKLAGLGMWKESMDLGLFFTMRECEVAEEEWVDRLCARLQEKLCMRISDLRDEDAGYDAVKGALLKAAGETTITYGHRIF